MCGVVDKHNGRMLRLHTNSRQYMQTTYIRPVPYAFHQTFAGRRETKGERLNECMCLIMTVWQILAWIHLDGVAALNLRPPGHEPLHWNSTGYLRLRSTSMTPEKLSDDQCGCFWRGHTRRHRSEKKTPHMCRSHICLCFFHWLSWRFVICKILMSFAL